MNLKGHQDYRDALGEELEMRIQRNRAYSLRAFARDLGLPYSSLAEVMAKRKGFSLMRAEQVAHALNLNAEERRLLILQVQSLHARSPRRRKDFARELQKYYLGSSTKKLSLDLFKYVADWQHYAILELAELPNFRGDMFEIAQRLNILPALAEQSLARLERLGLLKKQEGKLVPCDAETWSPNDIPSSSIRAQHRQVLGKAIEALETQGVEEREFQSVTFAASAHEITNLKTYLRQIVNEFVRSRAGKGKSSDSVYSFNLQLFRLDHSTKKPNKKGETL